jgi:hypothetical protein
LTVFSLISHIVTDPDVRLFLTAPIWKKIFPLNRRLGQIRRLLFLALTIQFVTTEAVVWAQSPNPVLNSVYPPGGRTGKTVEVTVSGSSLDGLKTLVCNHSGITCEKNGEKQFRLTIPEGVPSGLYELRTVGLNGLSSPRSFFVSDHTELLETEPNETPKTAQSVSLNLVINGRIGIGGDLDGFRFSAKKGQRILIECWAERIDSRLRAVMELYDDKGRRLAVNRGYFGIDPLIHFQAPNDGTYVVKIFDLIYSGSSEHFYRLNIGTAPRVAFTVPSVVERNKTTRVTLFGWNLHPSGTALRKNVMKKSAFALRSRNSDTESTARSSRTTHSSQPHSVFEFAEVDVTPPKESSSYPMPVRLLPPQIAVDGFVYHYPGSYAPVLIGATGVPVFRDQMGNHTPDQAQKISFPSVVSGQLVDGDERDWYAIQARRGEVLWIEAFGERLGSPVDLDVSVMDSSGKKKLARFSDEVKNIGGKRFPSDHLDPAGRWVAPADGRYLILIRNLIGGLETDPRRVYQLSVRREEPDVHLVVVPHFDQPASLNVSRGGRSLVDVFAFRRRGLTGPILVSANNLPEGVECPDIWLGSGVNRAPLVVTADRNAPAYVGKLTLEGHAESAGIRTVRGGTMVRTGLPNGSGRLTSEIPLAVAGKAQLLITADGHEKREHHLFGKLKVRHSPGGILDVAVDVERSDADHTAPVELIGVGLPALINNQTATIPAGRNKGYLSFYLPPTLPTGRYTIAVKAQTTVPVTTNSGKQQTKSVTVSSNPVTFNVQPAAFIVEVDPYAPKTIQRGKIVQVKYTAKRMNGFLGKIHTELAATDKVAGLRVRGVTFVGQTESGTLQFIANEDARLGRQKFLRLFAVGVVEDQAAYHGSCFLDLEIIE